MAEGASKNSAKFDPREVASNPRSPKSVSAPDSGKKSTPFTHESVGKALKNNG
jgi:hypothetical protein